MNVTFFSINLWNTNEPVKKRMDALVAFLKATRPHVIFIQEVSLYENKLQSLYIKEQLNYLFHLYSYSGLWKNREEGIAILSNIKPFEIYTYDLKSSITDMPRKLQVLRINIEGKSYTIANTHLSHITYASRLRFSQAKQIKNILEKWNNVILGGDFNSIPNSQTIKILTSDTRLIDIGRIYASNKSNSYTISLNNPYVSNNMRPNRRIDYFLISQDLSVQDYKIVLKKNDEYGVVSDHYGILFKIKV
jgi:endonuclease/exonuclease/phosphatase family metal-dependent hydrolase